MDADQPALQRIVARAGLLFCCFTAICLPAAIPVATKKLLLQTCLKAQFYKFLPRMA